MRRLEHDVKFVLFWKFGGFWGTSEFGDKGQSNVPVTMTPLPVSDEFAIFSCFQIPVSKDTIFHSNLILY